MLGEFVSVVEADGFAYRLWKLTELARDGLSGESSFSIERGVKNIVTSFKILAALALLSATASTPVFSRTSQRQALHNYVSGVGSHWCLRNYSADKIDCSYADRSQCAETAAGGAGPM